MVLLGRVNWWLPAWLDRLLPHMDIEDDGHGPARPPKDAVADAAFAGDGGAS